MFVYLAPSSRFVSSVRQRGAAVNKPRRAEPFHSKPYHATPHQTSAHGPGLLADRLSQANASYRADSYGFGHGYGCGYGFAPTITVRLEPSQSTAAPTASLT
ncbi:hypothetical protein JOC69_000866 [Heliobacterium gestii]|nr:hypothetical protein [Heliomicrobium gestii]